MYASVYLRYLPGTCSPPTWFPTCQPVYRQTQQRCSSIHIPPLSMLNSNLPTIACHAGIFPHLPGHYSVESDKSLPRFTFLGTSQNDDQCRVESNSQIVSSIPWYCGYKASRVLEASALHHAHSFIRSHLTIVKSFFHIQAFHFRDIRFTASLLHLILATNDEFTHALVPSLPDTVIKPAQDPSQLKKWVGKLSNPVLCIQVICV